MSGVALTWRTAAGSLVLILLLVCPAAAQLVNENLLVRLPPGYKVDFQVQKNNMVMNEMVPTDQTVDNWTEMVTVQIFHGAKFAPQAFMEGLQQRWIAHCPGGTRPNFRSGVENGYQMLLWLLDCPRNPDTGKPEITWFKAIAGSDSFYLVQKAFRFAPSKEQVAQWLEYLKSVTVCDTRVPERACPQSKN